MDRALDGDVQVREVQGASFVDSAKGGTDAIHSEDVVEKAVRQDDHRFEIRFLVHGSIPLSHDSL